MQQKIFTARFVKDLILIAVFSATFYTLTHNPLTHPIPEEVKGVWSIQLMQHPLVFGIAGHNFLTLRNEKNDIVEELHGLATDATTGDWKYVGNTSTDQLRVWEFNGSRAYVTQKNYAGTVLFKGNKTEAVTLWRKALTCKKEINDLGLPYPPYGVNVRGDTENSNSVAYTLTLCMGLDAEHLGLVTPGWGKNLLETKP